MLEKFILKLTQIIISSLEVAFKKWSTFMESEA